MFLGVGTHKGFSNKKIVYNYVMLILSVLLGVGGCSDITLFSCVCYLGLDR